MKGWDLSGFEHTMRHPQDRGSASMRRAVTAAAIVAVGAVVGVVLSVGPTVASPFGSGGTVDTNILSAPRLEATVSTEPGTWLAVAGDSTGATLDVRIPGTVSLSNDTLSALNGRTCTPGGQGKVGVAGAVVGLPPIPEDGGTGAQQGRTSIAVGYPNQAGTGFVSCAAGGLDGGPSPLCAFPDAGFAADGWAVDEGGSAVIEISGAYILRCRSCNQDGTTKATDNTGRVVISYLETSCTTP